MISPIKSALNVAMTEITHAINIKFQLRSSIVLFFILTTPTPPAQKTHSICRDQNSRARIRQNSGP